MIPVTDPNLIAQLEGNSSAAASYGTPVTDPALIAQLEGNGQLPQGNPSLLPRVGGDVLAGLAQFGHGLMNAPSNIANTLNKNLGSMVPSDLSTNNPSQFDANIPRQQDYNYSSMLGVNAPNLGDKLIQGAAQYAPYMALPGGMMTQGTAFGATQSQNPGTGALISGALGGLGEFAPTVIGGGKKLLSNSLSAIQPQKFAQQLMQILGGGNTLEGNAQSLAQDIKGAFANRVNQGQELYKPVFDSAGNNSIYDGVNQASVRQPVSNFNNLNDVIEHVNDATGKDLENTGDLKDYLMQQHGFSFPNNKSLLDFFNSAPTVVNNGAYNTLDDGIINSYDRNLSNLHQQFTDNPTLQNAHNLQSQLGSSIRKLQANDAKGNLSVADRNTMQGYQAAQGAVRSDINTYLTSQNPALASQYNLASQNWAQNVTPYLENSKIAQIAKGDITNPTAITNLFKSPEPEIQQIVNDIGPQANNKILYSELGKTQSSLSPEKLTSAYNQLDNKGLSSYITPDLAQQFEQLASKTSARNTAQTAAGGILGAHFFGPLGAVAGAAGPRVLGKLGQYAPSINLPLRNTLMNTLRMGYRPTSNAISANLIDSKGGQ